MSYQKNKPSDLIHEYLHLIEAELFASPTPIAQKQLARFLPPDTDIIPYLESLQLHYQNRGIQLVRRGGAWVFRTNPKYAERLAHLKTQNIRLSNASMEILAIIAYHQPITKAEIENIRGLQINRNTIDLLVELKWINVKGTKKTLGKPMLFGTTDEFLDHFSLSCISQLPDIAELRKNGLLDLNMTQ